MSRARQRLRNGRRRLSAALLIVALVAAGLAVPAGAGSTQPLFLATWGTEGSGDGQFVNPFGVAVGPDGTVYVADTDNDRIQYFTPTGDLQGAWGSSGSENGQFSSPFGVAVAPTGTVYVADTGNHRIQYFTPTGDLQGSWGSNGSENGQFSSPRGVAVAPNGTVYVADTSNHRIQHFDPTGTHQGTWGTFGSENSQFSFPQTVAVALNGTVYVADRSNHRIQTFDPTGTFQGSWGTLGSNNGQFDHPVGVAVAADGTVYVADTDNHRIQHFDHTGDFRGTWGTSGSGDGQFNLPRGVAAGPFGVVYIADRNNHRIQEFTFPAVTRLAGANRFATAAAISQHHHPAPQAVDTVFVATGANFPDALAGAVAAAATQSPLLLTSSVPQDTENELDRLDPTGIIILGGQAAVSAATAEALGAFASVGRLAGANRYETAIAISQHAFPTAGSADAVVIATGENFPDALAAAPLAAQVGGPVLLTPTTSLPQAVADEIERLDPAQIYIVGGTSAVSSAVFSDLTSIAPATRISGPNRYLTAIEISKTAFPDGAGVVYVAVGTNFPDALAGAAQAAFWGAPVLLTPTDTLPAEVIVEIVRVDPHTIIILGGEAVVSAAVENALKALLGI